MSGAQDKSAGPRGAFVKSMPDGTHLTLTDRMRLALADTPRSEWPVRLARSEKQILRYLDGADVPASVLTSIAHATGVPGDWLFSGRASPGQSGRVSAPRRPGSQLPAGKADPGSVAEGTREFVDTRQSPLRQDRSGRPFVFQQTRAVAATLQDYVGISRANVDALTAPQANLHDHPQVVEHLAFKKEFLKAWLNTEPEDLLLVEAADDAMEPGIPMRAVLTVDIRADRPLENGGIYVIEVENALIVRRLHIRMSGDMILRCDNVGYAPESMSREAFDALKRVGIVRLVLAPPQRTTRAAASDDRL